MAERGYSAGYDDQVLADLSVEHSGTLDRREQQDSMLATWHPSWV
jgi:hypothetical protein